MENYKELQDKIKEQEYMLQFDSFSNQDAYELGIMFVNEAKKRDIPIAVEIRRNNSIIFAYSSEKTSDHNRDWLNRKANSVSKLDMSTLRLFYYLLDTKRDMEKDMYLDPGVYGIKGGGFPIRIKGTGLIGSVCVSSLPHEEDHKLILNVISDFLKLNLENMF